VFGTRPGRQRPRGVPGRAGIAIRAVSRHRPDVLADVGQGTGPGVHGRRAHLPQEAPQAFAQAAVDVDGFYPRKTEKPSHD
jgi:hypothetical protein